MVKIIFRKSDKTQKFSKVMSVKVESFSKSDLVKITGNPFIRETYGVYESIRNAGNILSHTNLKWSKSNFLVDVSIYVGTVNCFKALFILQLTI